MDFFLLLGIEPTEDKALIRAAYREKLPFYHPEEDPEGFQKLRDAYEKAMKYTPYEMEIPAVKTPVDAWIDAVDLLYKDFKKRIDPAAWTVLLEDEVVFSLHTFQETSHRLLNYVAENYYIPQLVWQLLNETFNWKLHQETLKREFSEEFIDAVISWVDFKPSISYDAFDPEATIDFDAYIRAYYFFHNQLYTASPELLEAQYAIIKQANILHPDADAMIIYYLMKINDFDAATTIAKNLLDKYPENMNVLFSGAKLYLALKEYEKALELCQKILTLEPKLSAASNLKGDIYMEMGDYKEATEAYDKSLDISYRDIYANQQIYLAYEKRFESFKEDPEGADALLEYLEIAVKSRHFEEALLIGPKIDEKAVAAYPYNYFLGHMYLYNKQYEASIPHYEIAQELAEKTEKKADIYVLLSEAYVGADKKEKALGLLYEGLKLDPSDREIGYRKTPIVHWYMAEKNFEKALQVALEILVVEENYHIYYTMATIYKEMGAYNIALQSIDKAIANYRLVAFAFFKLELLNLAGYSDMAIELSEELLDAEILDIAIYLAKMEAYIEKGDMEGASACGEIIQKKYPEALEVHVLYMKIYRKEADYVKAREYLEKSQILYINPVKYFQYAAEIFTDERKYDQAIEHYKRALHEVDSPKDIIYAAMGQVEDLRDKFEDALTYYQKVLEINPTYKNIHRDIGNVYYEMKAYADAHKYLDLAIKEDNSVFNCNLKGLIYLDEKKMDEAIETFINASEISPSFPYAYYNLGRSYVEKGDIDKAIVAYLRSIELEYPYYYAHERLTRCYTKLGAFEAGKTLFIDGMKKFPTAYFLYLQYGRFLLYNGNTTDEVMENFQNWIKNVKTPVEKARGYVDIGRLYESRLKFKEAIKAYMKAFSLDAKNDLSYYHIANLYMKDLNRRWRGKRLYEKAATIDETDGDYPFEIGRYYFEKKKFQDAKKYFQKALKLYEKPLKKQACDFRNIGKTYGYLGDLESAISYLQQAVDGASQVNFCNCIECYDAYDEFANIYEFLAIDYEKSKLYYEKALKVNPHNRSIQRNYQRLLQKMK